MMNRFLPFLLSALFVQSAYAEGWVQSYVVEWFEPAFYYGADEGVAAPGTDCPAGTIPEPNRRQLLKTAYRTWAEVDEILDPEKPQWNRYGGIRGPNGENVYDNPWTAPDPGMTPVTGDISWGFDLDGDNETGFKSPDGRAGVDNAYYRAAGCWKGWRGPEKSSHHAMYVNDGMRDGVFSVVMVISGEGDDPANDPNAKLGVYLSMDKMVKDANGDIAKDYTFRINTDPRFQSVMDVRTVDGRIESKAPSDLTMRDVETAPFFPAQLKLFAAQLSLSADDREAGNLVGYLGGYRPVKDYYTGWAAAGAIHEAVVHMNMVGYWYALQNNADFKTDPTLEKPDAISTAYRLFLTSAFVATPDGTDRVTRAELFAGEIDESLFAMRQMRRPQ